MAKPVGASSSCGRIWREISDLTLLEQCLVGREGEKGENSSSVSKSQNRELSCLKRSRKRVPGGAVPAEAKPRFIADAEPGPGQEQGPEASIRDPGCCPVHHCLGTRNSWPAQKEDYPSQEAGEGLAFTEHCYSCGLGWSISLQGAVTWPLKGWKLPGTGAIQRNWNKHNCQKKIWFYDFTPPEGIDCLLFTLGAD